MSDPKLEADLRRALRVRADGLEVDDRAFDPERGAPERGVVADLDDLAVARRPRRAAWTALAAAAVIAVGVGVVLLVRAPGSETASTGETVTTVAKATPTTVAEASTTTSSPVAAPSEPAPAALVEQVASVPVSTGLGVGRDIGPLAPRRLPGPQLVGAGGKPRIIWVGAEYCPYCVAQRWPLVIALSRFGTFSDLRVVSSATITTVGSPEVFPNTQSFSFHGATYQSDYVEFEAAETMDNRYKDLDELTPEQSALVERFDAPPYVDAGSQGAIPFVDIANVSMFSGASYDTVRLAEKTPQQIADALQDPTSPIAQDVGRVANAITASICSTVSQPDRIPVCSDPTIAAWRTAIQQGGS